MKKKIKYDLPDWTPVMLDDEDENTDKELNLPEIPLHRDKHLKVIFIVIASLIAVWLMFMIGMFVYLYSHSSDVICDIDTVPEYPVYWDNNLETVCRVDTLPGDIDTSSMGTHEVCYTFFGFIKKIIKVEVTDLTPPVISLHNVIAVKGTALTAVDFVASCDDKTEVSFSLVSPAVTDKAGQYEIAVTAMDVCSNSCEETAVLTVISDDDVPQFELGLPESTAQKLLTETYPECTSLDFESLNVSECGFCRINGRSDDAVYYLALNVVDTTPPSAKAVSRDIRIGTVLSAGDFVENIDDCSPVNADFVNVPDFTEVGGQTVYVALTDAYGNSTEKKARLCIWDIPESYTVELGTTQHKLVRLLSKNAGNFPKFDSGFDCFALGCGEYDTVLHGDYSDFPLKLIVRDTTPPSLILKDTAVYIGQSVSPEIFVSSVSDRDTYSLSFEKAPDTSKKHSENVTVIATDKSGNITKATASLRVREDTTPPVISGVRSIYANIGDNISYKSGVSAFDNLDGSVNIRVDASGVNTKKSGVYQVVYTATDKAGNTASVKARVVIGSVNQAYIDSLADDVLDTIVTKNMTDREKAYAIYKWASKNIKYSSSTAYLMGQFVKAAYYGFTSHSGNCYIYYAVCSELLTRCGIKNIMIQRDKPDSPHYWNLVSIAGNWYHFDACPHYKQYPLESFLLTDKQVADYTRNCVADYYSFDHSLYPATP